MMHLLFPTWATSVRNRNQSNGWIRLNFDKMQRIITLSGTAWIVTWWFKEAPVFITKSCSVKSCETTSKMKKSETVSNICIASLWVTNSEADVLNGHTNNIHDDLSIQACIEHREDSSSSLRFDYETRRISLEMQTIWSLAQRLFFERAVLEVSTGLN